jgi:galactitol-specific phosphotransferase system IIC component
MMVFALQPQETTLWEIALGLGLVVILVVIALLTLLSRLVHDIDVGVWNLWTMTKRAAQNTTGLYQLAGTGSIVRALREELLRHDNLLSGR